MVKGTGWWNTIEATCKYHTATIYKAVQRDNMLVRWRKVLFDNHVKPEAKFILWMALNEKMPTKDRLLIFRFINDARCCFYYQIKSIECLFFSVQRNLLDLENHSRKPFCAKELSGAKNRLDDTQHKT